MATIVHSEVVARGLRISWPATLHLDDGTVLVSGGQQDGEDSRRAFLFDSRRRIWRDLPDMQAGRFGHALVALPSGHALALGGTSDVDNEIWNGRQWLPTSVGGLPRLKHFSATRIDQSSILVTGGETIEGKTSDDSWVVCLDRLRVLRTAQMSSPKAYHESILIPKSKVVLVVGPADHLAECWNTETNEWTSAGQFVGRSGAQLLGLTDSALLVGGQEPEPMKIVERWHQQQWMSEPELPIATGGVPVIQHSAHQFAIIGAGTNNNYVLLYSAPENRWHALQAPSRRFAHGVAAVSEVELLVVGGIYEDTVEVLTIGTN